ncbi:MAG: tetratricopeptide repeat protein [Planctomycetota bacterium]
MRRIPSIALLLIFTVVANVGCAAQRHMDRGQAALLADDPVQARHHFARALEHDPKLARNSIFAEDYRVARRDAAVVEGEQALRLNQPLDAIARFEAALKYQSPWPPAQDGLTRAHAQAAHANHRHALTAADEGRLDRARAELEAALRHVPDHADATEALASLTTPYSTPPARFVAGQQHASEQAWDQALTAFRESVTTSPNFLPARAAIPATLDAAAQDMLDRGRHFLAQQQYDDAERALMRVADYRPAHPELQSALGQVDLARGRDALANDLPGAALLWFRRANQHFGSSRSSVGEDAEAGLRAATQQLRDRHRLTITLASQSATRPDLADDLAQRVKDRLQPRDALALSFDPAGQSIMIDLVRLELPAVSVRTESRLHPYLVEYDVPNPARPSIQHELHRTDRCIDDLISRERHLERRHRRLHAAHPFGPSCACAHEVHRVHRQLDQVRRELRAAHHDHRRVSRRLHATPHFITQTRTEYWPYTVSSHERTVTLVATFAAATHDPQTITTHLTDTDTTLSAARPDLGLPEDLLDLQTDAALQDELLTRTANRLAHELGNALIEKRIDQLTAEANQQQNSDPIAARESRVAAAVLLSAIDAKASEQQLDAMQ